MVEWKENTWRCVVGWQQSERSSSQPFVASCQGMVDPAMHAWMRRPVMWTLPEPAKSMTPIERGSSTSGCCVSQVTRKGDSQPCAQHMPSIKHAQDAPYLRSLPPVHQGAAVRGSSAVHPVRCTWARRLLRPHELDAPASACMTWQRPGRLCSNQRESYEADQVRI